MSTPGETIASIPEVETATKPAATRKGKGRSLDVSGGSTVVSKGQNAKNVDETGVKADSVEDENLLTVELKPTKAMKRSFRVVSIIHESQECDSTAKNGRWQSKTPAGAARKGANQACKVIQNGSDEPCTIDITIREVTRNKVEKDYSYRATRKLAEKHVDFSGANGGVNIGFKFTMILKSLKVTTTGETIALEEVPSEELTVESAA